ncbi:MAG: hopanoid biosynthesis-associated protein HpnK [Gammaproteobacteria bacterium]|nr:hopanoid biosynthesis-associated protein HpnK [Gammaproteobacteria bacterium]
MKAVRRVITTADDFGLSVAVNEAVERAVRDGVLTGASLMVGEAAADDAVGRARRLPQLRVGLHVVVAEGKPVLPPSRIPDLCDAQGRLDGRLVRAGVRFFFRSRVAAQLRAEIEAQFAAFADTGLVLDHVNAHKHMHLHPTVLNLIIATGRRYGMRAVRLPFEPRALAGPLPWRRRLTGASGSAVIGPWVAWMRRRLQRAGLRHNDYVFGLRKSGAVEETEVVDAMTRLPAGISEVYFHPSMDPQGLGELAALLSPRVRAAFEQGGVERVSFGEL